MDKMQKQLPDEPMPFTPLIGREQEVQAACTLLRRPEVRLLTVTGIGGIGKTRLALQIVANMQQDFPSGFCFIPLVAIHDPALLVPVIAEALGLRGTASDFLFEDLVDFLRPRRCLLVLDNFEQLVAAAPTLGTLISACPDVKVMVTSRAVLRMQGEYEFVVPPLALPDLRDLSDIDKLSGVASVALFMQRAQSVRWNFQLTTANALAIVDICHCLDGVPLAIELAAARIKILSPQTLLTRLENRLQVLTNGGADLAIRHQTLRNTLTWSYGLLNRDERWLFRNLSVFVGGCTLEAIEALCTALSGIGISILDNVTSLVDKSLLHAHGLEDEPRIRMLETVREYGLELLTTRGDRKRVMAAHAAYYRALAKQAEVASRSGEQGFWVMRLEQEYGNIRAALSWLLEQNELEAVLHFAAALEGFWFLSRYVSEGRDFLQRALIASNNQAVSLPARAKALYVAGRLAIWVHDIEQTINFLEEGVQLLRSLGDKQLLVSSLSFLSSAENHRNQFAVADALYEEALRLAREGEDSSGTAQVLMAQGIMALFRGQFAQVRALCKESIVLSQKVGDMWIVAINLHLLGWAAVAQGEYAVARRYSEEALTLLRMMRNPGFTAQALTVLAYEMLALGDETKASMLLEEALALAKEVGDKVFIAQVLCGSGSLALHQGNMAQAHTCYEESMQTVSQVKWKTLEVRYVLASCLEGRGIILLTQGQPAWAVQLFGAAEALRTMNGYRNSIGVEQTFLDRCLSTARSQLGEEPFAEFWTQGQTMTPEQALAAEGQISSSEPIPAASPSRAATKSPFSLSSPDVLTRREIEVLRLLAEGLTNTQITERLVISASTVNTHVQSIYTKLGITSRSAATRYAIEHHLV